MYNDNCRTYNWKGSQIPTRYRVYCLVSRIICVSYVIRVGDVIVMLMFITHVNVVRTHPE